VSEHVFAGVGDTDPTTFPQRSLRHRAAVSVPRHRPEEGPQRGLIV
jgi:hypothetical protein